MSEPAAERRRGPGVTVLPLRVRRAREDAGLTLAQLADGKLSRTAIHLIEMGRSRPSEGTLTHIASRTGRPVGYFLGEGPESPGVPPTETARRVLDLLRQSSWSLAHLLSDDGLTASERVALEGMLIGLRQSVRLVQTLYEDTAPRARRERSNAVGDNADTDEFSHGRG